MSFDPKQLFFAVVGGVCGIGMLFLIGAHLSTSFDDDAAASSRLVSTSLQQSEVSRPRPRQGAVQIEKEYEFFALLEEPAPQRDLPEIELAVNPAIQAREARKEERRRRRREAKKRGGVRSPKLVAKAKRKGSKSRASKPAVKKVASAKPAAKKATSARKVASAKPAAKKATSAKKVASTKPAAKPAAKKVASAKPAAKKVASAKPVSPLLSASFAEPRAKAVKRPARVEAAGVDSAAPDKNIHRSQGRARYTVQVGAFQSPDVAEGMLHKLGTRGYKAHIKLETLPNNRKLYRVRVGRFETQGEARRYGARMKSRHNLVGFPAEI